MIKRSGPHGALQAARDVTEPRKWAESGWVPMRRLTTPADVGNLVALLCSKEAGFVTGQTVYVDGGASLGATDLPMELQAGG